MGKPEEALVRLESVPVKLEDLATQIAGLDQARGSAYLAMERLEEAAAASGGNRTSAG